MLRAREHGGPEKNAFDSRLFFGFSQRASGRGKAKRWIDFFVIWPFTCLYIFNGLIIVFNEAKRYFLFVLWFTPMNWKSWSAASKCRKTHPCDYRISKFSWGACPRNPLGGKPSRPCQFFARVQNLNEPPAIKTYAERLQPTTGLTLIFQASKYMKG